MIKKLKKHFELKKRERIEVLETLSTICSFLELKSKKSGYCYMFRGHYKALKEISNELQGIEKESE